MSNLNDFNNKSNKPEDFLYTDILNKYDNLYEYYTLLKMKSTLDMSNFSALDLENSVYCIQERVLTDKEKIKMAETFNASKFQILTKIVIPANISTLFNTLKVNIGLSLVGVISGEFLVSKGGLGYLIVYGGQVFKLDLVMTSVIILAIVAAVMYESIEILEKIVMKQK